MEKKSYKGLYLPQLSINASYTRLSDPLSLSFDKYKAPIQAQLGQLGNAIPAPLKPTLGPVFAQWWVGFNHFLFKSGAMSFKSKISGDSPPISVG